MTKTRYALVLAALLFGASAAAAEIVIGVAGPFSGSNAALGEQLRRGVETAVGDLNATGGIRGERIAVKFGDDGCDPRKAVEVATGFVSDGIKAVIGHYCSGSLHPRLQGLREGGRGADQPRLHQPQIHR